MNLRAIERRLSEIEARTGRGDTEAEARSIHEIFPGLVSLWIEGACAVRLGGEGDPHGAGTRLRVEVERHPLFRAEVNRRIPVLSAWITWHRVHREPHPIGHTTGPGGAWDPVSERLRGESLGNWDWACGAYRVAVRDGHRSPEAVALIEVGDRARIGDDAAERQRVGELTMRILADLAPSYGVPLPERGYPGGGRTDPRGRGEQRPDKAPSGETPSRVCFGT